MDVQARGASDKPALNGTVNGSSIQMTGKEVPQPVQIPAINLALTPAEVRSNNFNVTSAGTYGKHAVHDAPVHIAEPGH
jgi:hypothetical protein